MTKRPVGNGMMLSTYFAVIITHAHDEGRSALRNNQIRSLFSTSSLTSPSSLVPLSDISEDREAVAQLGAMEGRPRIMVSAGIATL